MWDISTATKSPCSVSEVVVIYGCCVVGCGCDARRAGPNGTISI
jgi:hypothetical protein